MWAPSGTAAVMASSIERPAAGAAPAYAIDAGSGSGSGGGSASAASAGAADASGSGGVSTSSERVVPSLTVCAAGSVARHLDLFESLRGLPVRAACARVPRFKTGCTGRRGIRRRNRDGWLVAAQYARSAGPRRTCLGGRNNPITRHTWLRAIHTNTGHRSRRALQGDFAEEVLRVFRKQMSAALSHLTDDALPQYLELLQETHSPTSFDDDDDGDAKAADARPVVEFTLPRLNLPWCVTRVALRRSRDPQFHRHTPCNSTTHVKQLPLTPARARVAVFTVPPLHHTCAPTLSPTGAPS